MSAKDADEARSEPRTVPVSNPAVTTMGEGLCGSYLCQRYWSEWSRLALGVPSTLLDQSIRAGQSSPNPSRHRELLGLRCRSFALLWSVLSLLADQALAELSVPVLAQSARTELRWQLERVSCSFVCL